MYIHMIIYLGIGREISTALVNSGVAKVIAVSRTQSDLDSLVKQV